ncbi:MAG: hypothetical protein N3B18_07215 [Desulfobacterota bacterium]|nr:hypothetical protein [Thermodesulfobacteriota bacterium]
MRSDILIGWALLYAPAGFLLGVILVFGCLPLYHRLRKTPPEKRSLHLTTKLMLIVLTTALFVGVMCGASVYSIESTKNDYWNGRCDWDSWRVPLGIPYELVMTGSMEHAAIRRWREGETMVSNIIRCEHQGRYVVGETGISRSKNDKTVEGWFLLDTATGETRLFSSYLEFERACQAAAVVMPLRLQSVRDVWYTYWKTIP